MVTYCTPRPNIGTDLSAGKASPAVLSTPIESASTARPIATFPTDPNFICVKRTSGYSSIKGNI